MQTAGNRLPMHPAAPDIGQLMERLRKGDSQAAGHLVTFFYPELRRLARSQMRGERQKHTWQPTVLVNQLYLELLKIRGANRRPSHSDDERTAFFRLAAHLMRRLLIHHARPMAKRFEVANVEDWTHLPASCDGDLKEVENLLLDLERMDPLFRTIAEMRALEGMSMEEVAESLNIPVRTAYRRWTFVREWLATHMAS